MLALVNVHSARRFLALVAPMGRMAFTNYICQSIILGFVFYGYGLALFGKLSLTAGFAIALAIYLAQAFASQWWLRRFMFGPLEWIWRVLMYGRHSELRKRTV